MAVIDTQLLATVHKYTIQVQEGEGRAEGRKGGRAVFSSRFLVFSELPSPRRGAENIFWFTEGRGEDLVCPRRDAEGRGEHLLVHGGTGRNTANTLFVRGETRRGAENIFWFTEGRGEDLVGPRRDAEGRGEHLFVHGGPRRNTEKTWLVRGETRRGAENTFLSTEGRGEHLFLSTRGREGGRFVDSRWGTGNVRGVGDFLVILGGLAAGAGQGEKAPRRVAGALVVLMLA